MCPFCFIENRTMDDFHIYDKDNLVHKDQLSKISLYISGSFMLILTVFGILENGVVLVTFLLYKKIRTINNTFLVGLTAGNLLQITLTFPQVISSSFMSRWLSGHWGCVFNAFSTTTLSLTQIAILTLIAVERYLIIVKQKTVFSRTLPSVLSSMLFCLCYGLAWAAGPLFGWSRYELESGDISCTIAWHRTDSNSLSYTMCLFTFVWFLPLIIISYCYFDILATVQKSQSSKRHSSQNRRMRERKLSMTIFLMIGAFVVSWTPYSIVSFWSVFRGDTGQIPIGAVLIPALLAKSSVVWNPLIYLSRHKEFRRACFRTLRCFRNNKTDESSVVRHVINTYRFKQHPVGCEDAQKGYTCSCSSCLDATVGFTSCVSRTEMVCKSKHNSKTKSSSPKRETYV